MAALAYIKEVAAFILYKLYNHAGELVLSLDDWIVKNGWTDALFMNTNSSY